MTEEEFERLFPPAVAWVRLQERLILKRGVPLSKSQMADAQRLEIRHPERIRIYLNGLVPFPIHPGLQQAVVEIGILGNTVKAACFGYGIWLHSDYHDNRYLLASELALLARHEKMGGIEPFLRVYLKQCVEYGSSLCPIALNAHELADCICQF